MIYRSLLVTALWFAAVGTGAAECQRDDVDHYLAKGFSTDQIIALCGKVPAASSKGNEIQVSTTPTEKISAAEDDAIFLATAVEAYDFEITPDAIQFSRETCIDFGWKDWNGFQERACPHVHYQISRLGLAVVARSAGFFLLSSSSISIEGEIQFKMLDLTDFPEHHQPLIQAGIEKRLHPLKLNVRSGMPWEKVEAVLLSLTTQ